MSVQPAPFRRHLGRVTLVVLLLAASWSLGPGCGRGVTFGPAGEPEGERTPEWLHFTLETDPAHASVARVWAAQYKPLGLRIEVEVLPWDRLVRRAREGESDACLAGWSGLSPSPLGLVASKLTPGADGNYSGYGGAELSRLLAGLLSRPNESQREACARVAQETLLEEAPWVFGVATRLVDASSAGLTGWISGPGGAVSLHDATLSPSEGSSAAETVSGPTGGGAGAETVSGPTGGGAAAETLPAGGRAVVGLGLGERPTLDPLRPADPQAATIIRCLFDALWTIAPDGTLRPELAASWDLSAEARRLVVRLRDGVVFHNGERLTPEDVVFSYETVLSHRLPMGIKVKVRVLDENSVVFDFSAPFPDFPELHGLQPIAPAMTYRTLGAEAFAAAPVGTGPFRFAGWASERQLVLARWDGYYGGCPALEPCRPASLGELVFLLVPEPTRRAAMLKAGQISLAPALSPEVAVTLTDLPGLTLVDEPGFTVLALELQTGRPPFNDCRVRLALNFWLDRVALAAELGPGTVVLPTAFLPEGLGFSTEVGPFPYDPGRARRLLTDAGFLTIASATESLSLDGP